MEGRAGAGRRVALSATTAGRETFAALDRASAQAIEALLGEVAAEDRPRLAAAFSQIRAALGEPQGEVILRPLQVGDIGWIAHRQGLLYAREYGWDATFEAMVARIFADFVEGFDPAREGSWIAERDGVVLGSVLLVKTEDAEEAKLRVLYVEPHARGLGLGARLVDAVIARARDIGYRTLTLWTNDILTAARKIYVGRGFQLVEEERHHYFGVDLVGQNWRLTL